MKKFIITVDTAFCGTERQYRTEAESAKDLEASELSWNNVYELCNDEEFAEPTYAIEEYSELEHNDWNLYEEI